MAAVGNIFVLAIFGLLHLATCQTATSMASQGGLPVQADVTAAVMAVLNGTGYSGKPTDPNIQEMVTMLMNGTVPTEADLMRMRVIPQPIQPSTAPPSYSLPGRRPVFDPSITLTEIGQPSAPQTGSRSSENSFLSLLGSALSAPQTGSPSSGNSFLSLSGVAPPGPLTGTGTGRNDLFAAGTFGNAMASMNSGPSPTAPETTPKPLLGDPFSMTAMAGPTLQNLALLDANALGPKPFASLDPIGGLGTPGSPTDLLSPAFGAGGIGAAGFGVGGMGVGDVGTGIPNQTGLTSAGTQQAGQQRHSTGPTPMMTMMMMNPELMEGMMAENPMMALMMMQQLNKPRPRPQPTLPTLPSMPMDMAGMAGLGGAGGMGGLGGQGLTGMDALGAGASMGLNQGSLAAGASSPGITDINSLLNMASSGMAGAGTAPVMDPMLSTMG